jgi:hypothetical protein
VRQITGYVQHVGDTVRLTVVPDEGEAQVICGLLRSEGIACFSRVSNIAAQGFLSHGGWHEVLVNEEDLSRARQLLDSAKVETGSSE